MAISKCAIKSLLKNLYPDFSSKELIDKLDSIITLAKKERCRDLKNWDKRLDKLWYKQSENIMYVLYADLFAADAAKEAKLKGLIERLDYLTDLGVTNIHILPALESSGDAGFAVDNYRKIDPELGTMADFKRLTRAAHAKGIKITFDLVLNHVSDSHKWASELKRGNKKYFDYFIIDETKTGKSRLKIPDMFPEFAPGHWDYVPEIDKYVWATFYSRYPIKGKKYNNFAHWDLNYKNPDVLFGMIENMLFLANRGVDVFRLDAVSYLWKELGTDCLCLSQVYEFMYIFCYALESLAPKATILVEACVANNDLVKFFKKDASAQLAYNFTIMPFLWYSVIRENVIMLSSILSFRSFIPRNCSWITFDVCHDEVNLERIEANVPGKKGQMITKFLFDSLIKDSKGEPFRFKEGEKYGYGVSGTKWSLLGGDLARNEKEINIVIKKIMLINAFKLSIGGVPLFYQGEELALSNDYSYKKDPKKSMDSRFVKRQKITDEMRERRKIRKTKEYKVFNELKKLIDIRKRYKIFGHGRTRIKRSRNSKLLVFERKFGKERLLVIMNFCGKQQRYLLKSAFKDLASGADVGKGKIYIEPYSFLWLYHNA